VIFLTALEGDDRMLTTERDPRAWTAATVGSAASWYYPLPAECLRLLDDKLQTFRRQLRPITELKWSAPERSVCARALSPARHALEQGRGFVILHGLPLEGHNAAEWTACYWLIGQALGEPLEQNVQGVLLYDVRDTGQELSQGALFSVTRYESSFHTDNSFGETVADYVGLLCLNPARSGGRSQLVSGVTVYQELRSHHPEALEVLRQPFHVDRRGGVRAGEPPTVHRPVVEVGSAGPLFRYLRYWIEAGHQKADVPLRAAQIAALDVLDEQLGRPDLRAEFELRRGDLWFVNNRWLLHNRTAFEDFAEPERRRHLVRLWLRSRHLEIG
jgi:alpha-ketoglutarate-dependent taurine dioxygenase